MRYPLVTGILFITSFLHQVVQAQIPDHGILYEVWEGIGGASVSDLTSNPAYPDQPTSASYITDLFESPTDILENYGVRMHELSRRKRKLHVLDRFRRRRCTIPEH
jgi:hypothetical protein